MRVERAEYWDDSTGQMMALEPAAAPANYSSSTASPSQASSPSSAAPSSAPAGSLASDEALQALREKLTGVA